MLCELCGHDSPIYKFVPFAIHDGDERPVCDSCFLTGATPGIPMLGTGVAPQK